MRNSIKKKRIMAAAASAVMSVTAVTGSIGGVSVPMLGSLTASFAAEASVKINATVGYAEGMYATWGAVSGAAGYNVYVDGVQIDSELIRQYSGYMRADAIGLKAGSHTMKVVPIINGKEDTSKAAEGTASVYAHDRSGYAFEDGHMPGAYNADGTLKDNAVVVYVTEETKDTVTASLNAEGKGNVECKGIQNIVTAYKKGKETRPISIRLIGNITDPANMPKGDLMVDTVTAGMTIEGIGSDATANGWGIVLKNCVDVEVRNLGTMNCNSSEGDNIGLQQSDSYCWVHNCDYFYGDAGSDADQVKGDGALDTKKSHHITHSYNHFFDNGKCNLQGANSSDTSNYITYHHNWYDHSDSRHPRVRVATVHVYNNYYDGNAKYGIGSTTDSDIFAENNYFRNCKNPMMISGQGTDAAGEGTFSGEVGGMIKAFGNIIEGGTYVPYSANNTQFDFYDAKSRDEQVPSSVKAASGGASYNNFDTASGMYSYQIDAAEDVPAILEAKAGRVDGGDFKWDFDDSVDDASYAVNSALKSALTSYDDSIVAIGSGFKEDVSNPPTTTPPQTKPSTPVQTTPAETTPAPVVTDVPAPVVPSGDVKVVYAGGWNEMAYLVCSGLSDASVTGVSYSGASTGSLKGDDLKYLVRDVAEGVRVDLLGLKPGTYSITLDTTKGKVVQSGITVGAQDRSGYAHFNYNEGVGAYTDGGELKVNAKVLYITDENKDTVSVTSKDGTTVKGIGNILNSVGQDVGGGKTSNGGTCNSNQGIIKKLAEDGTPLVIRIVGDVKAPAGLTEYDSTGNGGSVGDNGFMARMKSGKDITIEGVGNDAVINGWGFHFMAESAAPEFGKSFEVRNIAFRNVPEDCIGLEGVQTGDVLTTPVERGWVHNCEFYVPKVANPAESDKAEGDGACDFKRGQYFTNSYCYYEGYHKTNLVGSSDTSLQYHLTYHHNYWKNCESRGPLARQADIHMYNNVYDGQTSYCQNPRANAFIFSEYNAFVNECKDPCRVTSGGVVKSYNDAYISIKKGSDMQATVVTDKSQKVNSSNKYANFDTNASISYVPAGIYSLTEATGESLYTALNSLFETDGGCMDNMKISGGTVVDPPTPAQTTTKPVTPTEPSTPTTPTTPVTPAQGGYVHDFTANGTSSSFYTITGNLSTSKGTVNYDGKTLTQCLKMESATNIAFNAANGGKLTLVFVEPSATVKVDGTKYTASGNGIITVDVAAGQHAITKADTANLFYIVYSESGTQPTPTDPVDDGLIGDANCDGKVTIADSTAILQALGNPDKYGLSEQGAKNADCCNRGDGILPSDALAIQKIDAKIITSLPEVTK